MDDSGQEHQPKQRQEAKNDTSIKENKNKTQRVHLPKKKKVKENQQKG